MDFRDKTTFEAFVFLFAEGASMTTAHADLSAARLARQSAVNWTGAIERANHFYLPWKVPGTYRAAWAWGTRIFTAASEQKMQVYPMNNGYDETALQSARDGRARGRNGQASGPEREASGRVPGGSG